MISGEKRVLVTDAGQRASLAAIRTLRAAGWEVSAADHRPLAAARWSRFAAERHHVPDPSLDSGAFVAKLADILRSKRHDVLLLGTDIALLAASDHRAALEAHAHVGLPGQDAVDAAFSKEALRRAAEQVGLRSPPRVVCETYAAASAAARELGFPVIGKPTATLVRVGETISRPHSAQIDDERSLRRWLTQQDGQPVLIQQRELGNVHSFAGVMADDGLLAAVMAVYIRTWPVSAGNASCAVTVVPPVALRERLTAMVRLLKWRGVFEVEMIQRPDATFSVIDFNPRLYGSLALSAYAGASLPSVWCESLTGGQSPVQIAAAGVSYRWDEGELRNLLAAVRRRSFRDAAAILRPLRPCVHAEFAMSDPGPFLARAPALIKRRRA